MSKEEQYTKLVASRRTCSECSNQGVRPLRDCREDEFESKHTGPWTDWQGNLDAEIMVVGQEWGGVDNYLAQHGKDRDTDPTNDHLHYLLNSISQTLRLTPLKPPSTYQGQESVFKWPHYFTNCLLCLKNGGATHKGFQEPDRSCYFRCCRKFLKSQIDIVQPLVVVTLGAIAYEATLRSYDFTPRSTMSAALEEAPLRIARNTLLVPVFHTGYWGWMTRNRKNCGQQVEDWKWVEVAVLQGRARRGD
jgi:DNA polymerase